MFRMTAITKHAFVNIIYNFKKNVTSKTHNKIKLSN